MRYFKIKKIDEFLLHSFITTFFSLFALVLFVLVIQHFFIIFKDIAGKGLGVDIYAKLLTYIALGVFPNVFPIAVLIASLIVFGNFSENFELTAMRSVGLSLQRVLKFPFLFILFLSSGLFYFQNHIHPTVVPKVFALVNDVCQKRANLFIQEGIFCNNIPGYAIRVNKKNKNGALEGIIIYDRSNQHGKVSITTATSGLLYTTPDGNQLIMELTNGHNYIEPFLDKNEDELFYRNSFVNQKIKISLEALKMGNTTPKYAHDPRTRNDIELQEMIQEKKSNLTAWQKHRQEVLMKQELHLYNYSGSIKENNPDTIQNQDNSNEPQEIQKLVPDPSSKTSVVPDLSLFIKEFMDLRNHTNVQENKWLLGHMVRKALHNIKKAENSLAIQNDNENITRTNLNEFLYEKAHRLALSIRCIVMFLLAAALGCIIKKGGFGISVMIGSFLILLEYVLSIFGKEMAIEGVFFPLFGACFSECILLPFCFYFLVKAQKGLGLSLSESVDIFSRAVKKRLRKKRKTKIYEVIT